MDESNKISGFQRPVIRKGLTSPWDRSYVDVAGSLPIAHGENQDHIIAKCNTMNVEPFVLVTQANIVVFNLLKLRTVPTDLHPGVSDVKGCETSFTKKRNGHRNKNNSIWPVGVEM